MKKFVSTFIVIAMLCQNISTKTNSINPCFKIENTGQLPLNLKNIKLRYYYTKDIEENENFSCDWASIGESNIIAKFTKMPELQTNADYYFDLDFTNSVGKINPGQTIEIQSRIAKIDWSQMNQLNDYSFNAIADNYVDWDKVSVYIGNSLVWGKTDSSLNLLANRMYSNVELEWNDIGNVTV